MSEITLCHYMKEIIGELREQGKLQTASSYISALGHFSAFMQGGTILLSEINTQQICAFRDYLVAHNVSDNTVAYYLSTIRAVYNKAVKQGLIRNEYPFEEVSTRVAVPKYVALSKEQFCDLQELDLTGKPELAFARDMFLLSFYLRGMSYYDMAELKISSIRDGVIEYCDKDGEAVVVELEPVISEIIERYRGKTIGTDYLLPIYTPDTDNYASAVRVLNMQLKKIAAMAKIDAALTSATARHSWAAIALKKGLSKKLISRCLGYKNDYFSQKYLENLENLVITNVNRMVIGSLKNSR
ncbi:MAG: site-specific integrase [Rikenellaceae bacterium]